MTPMVYSRSDKSEIETTRRQTPRTARQLGKEANLATRQTILLSVAPDAKLSPAPLLCHLLLKNKPGTFLEI
jgi:hypothetical protein